MLPVVNRNRKRDRVIGRNTDSREKKHAGNFSVRPAVFSQARDSLWNLLEIELFDLLVECRPMHSQDFSCFPDVVVRDAKGP